MTVRSATASTNRVRSLAILIITIHLIGVLANAMSLVLGDPTYPVLLWCAFLLLKLAGLVSGILLLRWRRMGAWLFAACLVAGACVALAFTGPYTTALWGAAGAITLSVVMTGWLILRRDWGRLQ